MPAPHECRAQGLSPESSILDPAVGVSAPSATAREHGAVDAGGVPQALMSMLMQQCGLEDVTHLSCAEGLQPLQVRALAAVPPSVHSASGRAWSLRSYSKTALMIERPGKTAGHTHASTGPEHHPRLAC